MSTVQKFKESWEELFPTEAVPHNLTFLASPHNKAVLESALDSTIIILDKLHRELNKQQFIAQFVLQLMDQIGIDSTHRRKHPSIKSLPSSTEKGVNAVTEAGYVSFGDIDIRDQNTVFSNDTNHTPSQPQEEVNDGLVAGESLQKVFNNSGVISQQRRGSNPSALPARTVRPSSVHINAVAGVVDNSAIKQEFSRDDPIRHSNASCPPDYDNDENRVHSLESSLDTPFIQAPISSVDSFKKKLSGALSGVTRTASVPMLAGGEAESAGGSGQSKVKGVKPRSVGGLFPLGNYHLRSTGSMENLSKIGGSGKKHPSTTTSVWYDPLNKPTVAAAIAPAALPNKFLLQDSKISPKSSLTPPFPSRGKTFVIPSAPSTELDSEAGVLETDIDAPAVCDNLPQQSNPTLLPVRSAPPPPTMAGSTQVTSSASRLPDTSQVTMRSSSTGNDTTSSVHASDVTSSSLKPSKNRRATRMDVYEDALPFKKDPSSSALSAGSCSKKDEAPKYAGPSERQDEDKTGHSSDDEESDEPIYYNLLLLRQQTMDQANRRLFSTVKQTLSNKSDEPRTGVQHGNDAQQSLTPGVLSPLMRVKHRSIDQPKVEGDDSETVEAQKAAWRNRPSMAIALDSDNHSDIDELEVLMPPTGAVHDETSQMRKWVVKSILDSEHAYIGILGILMQVIISMADIDTIFHKIPELHRIHTMFIHELQPKVDRWSSEQCVAELFHSLAISEYQIAPSYLKTYQKAIATIHRCNQESPRFLELTKEISCTGLTDRPSLEELVHKPILRFQRNTLVLHDLIKNTATAHGDYDLLQKTLKIAQNFLENLENPDDMVAGVSDNQRYLAKHDLVVETVGVERKLRHMFLFNDMLVCARQKVSGKEKFVFEPKWSIALCDFSFDEKNVLHDEKQLAEIGKEEIESLKRKVNNLQNDLKVENKRAKMSNDAQRNWSFRGHVKNVEKIKKKLIEQKVALILASPCLLFNVGDRRTGRAYSLLMPSDYERTNWKSTIQGLLSKAQKPGHLSTQELHDILNSQKLQKLSTMGSMLVKEDFDIDEEYLSGSLSITIGDLSGLRQSADTYCCVEVDSYGHFFMQAKTNVINKSIQPKWNEEFEIDLEGAQTLRILCYQQSGETHELIGKCAFELSKDWLKGDVVHETISVGDEMSVSISLSLRSRAQTLKRTLSAAKEGLFGVRIRAVTRRESSRIPLIVTMCVEEIESRGLNDVGLYRVSGLSGEIQRLKKAFEKGSRAAAHLLKTTDIHILTGLLKLYFRELPEALFTDALYPNFVTGMGLSDPDAKEKYMVQLVRSLPEPNYSTAIYVLDHLVRVSQHVDHNKMTIQNLATVFGPTLLRPAVKETANQSREEMFSAGAHDAMAQVAILLFVLNLKAKGVSFSSR